MSDPALIAAMRPNRWKRRLRKIDLPMPDGVTVKNEWPWPEDGQQIQAGAVPSENTIYWRGARPDNVTMGHEVGHLLDVSALAPYHRKIQRIMGTKGQWQRGTGLHGGMDSPSEVFADIYGNLAAGKGNGSWDGAYSSPPELKQLVLFGELLERIGRKRGLGRYHNPLNTVDG